MLTSEAWRTMFQAPLRIRTFTNGRVGNEGPDGVGIRKRVLGENRLDLDGGVRLA